MPGRRFPTLLVLAATLACGGGDERIAIAPGLHLDRPAPASRATFAFPAAAGIFVDFEVEQRGADVSVALLGPDGEPLTLVDSPTGSLGNERLRAVTRAAGEHRLELRRLDGESGGRVAVTVREARPATPNDRLRADALAAYYRGEMIRLGGDGATLSESLEHYRRALALRRRLEGGDPEPTLLHHRLGEVLWALGRVAESQRALEDALAALPSLRDPTVEALLLNQLGRGWRALGEPVRAEATYRRAIALARNASDRAGEATALGNLAVLEEIAGETEAALVHHRASLAHWRGLGRAAEEVTQIANLAALYTRIGRTDDSADLLAEALALSADGTAPRDRAHLLIDLGWNELIAGRPERALPALDEALELARAAGDRRLEAGALDRRASALDALGRRSEARRGYREALRLVRRAGDPAARGHILLTLGQLALDDGELAVAGERFSEAHEVLSASGDRHGAVAARVALAAADRRAGDLAAAQRRLERAVAEIDALRAEVPGALSRSVFLATRYDAYEALVAVLMERHREHPEEGLARRALGVSERAKARSFAEALARGGGAAGAELRGLAARVGHLEHRRLGLLGDPSRTAEAESLEREVRRLLLAADRERALRDGRVETPVETLDAAEIQELLDADTALLAYALGKERSHLWRVERDAIAAFDLPPRRTIETLAQRVSALLADGDVPFVAAQTDLTVAALSGALLPPGVLDGLAGRRLAIVPADALHLVPFAMLPGPSGRPLLFDHEIVQLPSATALALQRRRLAGRLPAERELAVVADPVYTADDERLGRAAATTGSLALPHDLDRAAEDLGLDLARLAGSGREAEEILALVPPAERLAATGLAARRQLVVSGGLSGFRTLHFATHGLLHPTRPELSGLVLSLFDQAGRRRDGFLRAQEIAATSLPAELVVLSACRTGLGRPIRGEGLVGLPQAFFLAGARALVVSLRPVSDRRTVELMTRFHELRLRQGLSLTAALRQAQIEHAGQPDTRPGDWAGFILMGDWR